MEPEEESGCMRGTYQMILFASLLKSASLIFRNHSESGHPGWFCLHVLSSRFSQLLLNLDTAGTLNRRKSLVSHLKIQAKCARPWERLKMLIWVFLWINPWAQLLIESLFSISKGPIWFVRLCFKKPSSWARFQNNLGSLTFHILRRSQKFDFFLTHKFCFER